MSLALRKSKRTVIQQFLTDPIIGIAVFIFIGFFKILPVRTASAIGGFFGASLYYVMKNRNQIGRKNLSFAFPNKTPADREKILKAMWRHWGRVYGELPHAAYLYRQARKKGLSYLQEQARLKQGCFVCSGHFGNFEISAATYLFDTYCLNPVYRSANNPWLDKLLFQRRKGVLIPKGAQGAKKMLDVLKQGGAVVLLCDQKLREGISVPFFNKPAQTAPAVATIALKMDLPIYMARCVRGTDGVFDIEVYPLPLSKQTNKQAFVEETMLKINQELEKWIYEKPEQWLWIHRRFEKSQYQ